MFAMDNEQAHNRKIIYVFTYMYVGKYKLKISPWRCICFSYNIGVNQSSVLHKRNKEFLSVKREIFKIQNNKYVNDVRIWCSFLYVSVIHILYTIYICRIVLTLCLPVWEEKKRNEINTRNYQFTLWREVKRMFCNCSVEIKFTKELVIQYSFGWTVILYLF